MTDPNHFIQILLQEPLACHNCCIDQLITDKLKIITAVHKQISRCVKVKLKTEQSEEDCLGTTVCRPYCE